MDMFKPAFMNRRPSYPLGARGLAAALALAGCAYGPMDAGYTVEAGATLETGVDAGTSDAPVADAAVDAASPSPTESGAPNDAGDGASLVDPGLEASTGSDAGDGSVVDASEAGRDASSCTGDLSHIGTGDFHISATITTVQSGLVALANQRSSCTSAVFWDIRIQNGLLLVETDDTKTYAQMVSTGSKVNDGQPHVMLVKRTLGTLAVYVDGVASGTQSSASSFSTLPPTASGTDPCIGHPNDATVAFAGTIANLCVAAP